VQATWDGSPLPALDEAPAADGTPHRLAIVAVPVDSPAGQISLRVEATDGAGNAGSGSVTLPVETVDLPTQALEVPASLASLATGPLARDEAARVAALTGAVRPDRLWTGPFRAPLPASAPRTTDFGDRREYDDGAVVYHAGYDLAAPAGTPVGASADGVVSFTGQLPQRGNTLILDHGWGVFTVYGHLSRFDVDVGQRVTQGQPVARVGSTGLSTGPHLHWEVRLRGLPVDPDAWVALSASLTPAA
jgi:murein DD-endopeptidase MepM/ murein hydrolase activator NlpD